MMLHVLIAMVAGWIQRHQQQVIAYLQEENRVLKAQLGPQRLRLTDTERRRLAVLAYPLGRKRLKELATLATPDTLMRWYHRLIAQKFDGSTHRSQRVVYDLFREFSWPTAHSRSLFGRLSHRQ